MKNKLLSLLYFFSMPAFTALGQDKIIIEPRPATILIEQGNNKQIINFDFLVSGKSKDTLSLDKLSISVFNKDNNLLQSRFLDNNGTAPAIMLLPKRIWNGEITHLVFNPFAEFEITAAINKLVYEWTFTNTKNEQFIFTTVVYPKQYSQKTALSFPLKGRILVYDAHDYNSHHRRFDYNFEFIKQLGLTSNFMRYAYDFMLVDKNNKQFKNKGESDQDFYGFGSTVYSVAAGKVIYVANDHKDDKKFDVPKLKDNPLELYGNCIAVQHADKSISIYGHLKEKSITIKPGDMVKQQQPIAQIGVSGSSFLPHLHFEIRNSITHSAEGLPSYFEHIFLLEGKLKKKLAKGLAETGSIIEAK